MNNKIETLKSNTILFTGIELVKSSFPEWLVDEIFEINEKYKDEQILKEKLKSKDDLIKLKEFLDREIKHQDDALYDSCIEELREMKEDLRWSSSKDGKFILKLEDWVLDARNKIAQQGWDKIFIGRSIVDPKELNIGGWVRNSRESVEIKAQIDSWAPPVSPRYTFETG